MEVVSKLPPFSGWSKVRADCVPGCGSDYGPCCRTGNRENSLPDSEMGYEPRYLTGCVPRCLPDCRPNSRADCGRSSRWCSRWSNKADCRLGCGRDSRPFCLPNCEPRCGRESLDHCLPGDEADSVPSCVPDSRGDCPYMR